MMKDDERNIQFVALKMEFLILCKWDLAGVTNIRCHRTSFPKLQLLLSSLFYNSTSALRSLPFFHAIHLKSRDVCVKGAFPLVLLIPRPKAKIMCSQKDRIVTPNSLVHRLKSAK